MRRITRGAALAACLCAVALAMGNAVGNGYVYDDVPIIQRNPGVTHPASWLAAFHSTYWNGTLWRPVTMSGYALQWILGHGSPVVFHLISLLAYLAAGALLLELLRRFGASVPAAAIAVVCFLVHPVHVEVVANVVGQAELWTALALMGGVLLYRRARDSGDQPGTVIGVLLVVVIGTMTKEQGFVAPALLLGAELLFPTDRIESHWSRFRLVLLVTGVTLIMLVLRSGVTGSIGGETPAMAFRGAGFGARAMTFLGVVPEYARLLVWPVHLQADYTPPQIPIGGPLLPRHLLGGLLLAVGAMMFWRSRRRTPVVAFGLWWAAMTLAPVSNLVTATGIVMAERVFFLPTIGFAMALAGGIDVLLTRRVPRVVPMLSFASLALWVVGATIRSHLRVRVWRDQPAFFTALTVDAPRSYGAWREAGFYWQGADAAAKAEYDLRVADSLWPGDPMVGENLGQLLRSEHRCGEAIPILVAALADRPDRASTRARLVECLISERRWDEAERVARAGVALGQVEFADDLERVARGRGAAGSH